jgi:hypothetical protein
LYAKDSERATAAAGRVFEDVNRALAFADSHCLAPAVVMDIRKVSLEVFLLPGPNSSSI